MVRQVNNLLFFNQLQGSIGILITGSDGHNVVET
jgi:hypothetical protein